jgi:hypothetical protein
MIERQTLNGKEASVQYLTAEFEPASKEQYVYARVVFDDGDTLLLMKPATPFDKLKGLLSIFKRS